MNGTATVNGTGNAPEKPEPPAAGDAAAPATEAASAAPTTPEEEQKKKDAAEKKRRLALFEAQAAKQKGHGVGQILIAPELQAVHYSSRRRARKLIVAEQDTLRGIERTVFETSLVHQQALFSHYIETVQGLGTKVNDRLESAATTLPASISGTVRDADLPPPPALPSVQSLPSYAPLLKQAAEWSSAHAAQVARMADECGARSREAVLQELKGLLRQREYQEALRRINEAEEDGCATDELHGWFRSATLTRRPEMLASLSQTDMLVLLRATWRAYGVWRGEERNANANTQRQHIVFCTNTTGGSDEHACGLGGRSGQGAGCERDPEREQGHDVGCDAADVGCEADEAGMGGTERVLCTTHTHTHTHTGNLWCDRRKPSAPRTSCGQPGLHSQELGDLG